MDRQPQDVWLKKKWREICIVRRNAWILFGAKFFETLDRQHFVSFLGACQKFSNLDPGARGESRAEEAPSVCMHASSWVPTVCGPTELAPQIGRMTQRGKLRHLCSWSSRRSIYTNVQHMYDSLLRQTITGDSWSRSRSWKWIYENKWNAQKKKPPKIYSIPFQVPLEGIAS